MNQIFKICATVLIACVISLVIEKKEKDLAVILTLCSCCCVIVFSLSFIRPVVDFIHSLERIASIDQQALQILFKVVGISLVSEMSSMICQDAGRSALGKTVQICATIIILWISLPLFTKLIELVSKIMEGL